MQEVLVTSKDFENLVNPYTGQRMVVKMAIGFGDEPMFHSVNTYSTADLQKSTRELFNLWGRVDGRGGLRSGKPKCAYTGEPLAAKEIGGLYRFDGGFDPKVYRTREEFLYYATMRDGKPVRPKPESVGRVTKPASEAKPSEGQKRHADSVTPGASQESVEMAAKAIEAHKDDLNLPTKVSMSTGRKRK